jgi:serine/threonine-protein kinase
VLGAEGSAAGPEPSEDPLLGARVGSFQIVRMLGRGGMGTVYLGEHPVIGSRVAIKFLHEAMARDPGVVARFFDEARAVNLIGHENIVGIFDLAALPPSRYYYVMELLEGETLTARLGAGRLSPPVAREVLLQLCDALAAAHARGVVHRDLKPDNVFLVARRGVDHFVKLVDFGIAKLRDAGAGGAGGRHTGTGLIVGTPEYMAPEQCEDRAVDARTDVYALGVMAYELFTGQLPFQARSVPALLVAHVRAPPPPPAAASPGFPDALAEVLLRALAKDPAARFPDTVALAAALRAAPLPGARPAGAPAAPPPAPAPPPRPAPEPPAAPEAAVLVRAPGEPERRGRASDVGRAGLFVRCEPPFPRLRARVALALAHPALRAELPLAGDVVRHVAPADAAAWGGAAGFAVQLVDLAPEARAALASLEAALPPPAAAPAGAARTPAPPSPAGPAGAAPEGVLARLEAREGGDAYAFLDLAPDAEFVDVRRAVRALREALEAVAARPGAPDHPARAARLLARVERAQADLAQPPARLAHDARAGNWRGVQRALAAGVPAALVEARRRELHERAPARAAEAARQLARARVALKLGNRAAALAACEAALAADPLDPGALDTWRALSGRPA